MGHVFTPILSNSAAGGVQHHQRRRTDCGPGEALPQAGICYEKAGTYGSGRHISPRIRTAVFGTT